MSDQPTPRTDVQEFKPVHGCGHFPPYPTVSSAFARQLEHELAEAREEIAILRSDEKRLVGFSKRDRKRADDLSDQLAKVVCDRDKTCVENLEQARLLGMSAEREADLRGELEREKRKADGIRYELTAARDERDRYLSECNRLHDELKAERKASFRDERDRLVAALKGISSASPAKWDVPRDEFKHDFEPWAKNVASAAIRGR
jgi:chromosome segregation ATPase